MARGCTRTAFCGASQPPRLEGTLLSCPRRQPGCKATSRERSATPLLVMADRRHGSAFCQQSTAKGLCKYIMSAYIACKQFQSWRLHLMCMQHSLHLASELLQQQTMLEFLLCSSSYSAMQNVLRRCLPIILPLLPAMPVTHLRCIQFFCAD